MADRAANIASSPTGLVRQSLPLDVSGGDHTPADLPNGFHANSDGNIVGRLQDDTADRTFAVLAGLPYPYRFSVVRQTGTTASGQFLYTI
ncbi:hypothetical protein R5W23_000830 [Gemmata sp. JC673]|uniref:Uncharacterized protein n=1 Tax=Gemmata algarum TaxID=2975278 RepID=A0ABU5ET26_9BACT|nr:hypothetical protein [Gemmata algarum]MDY3558109.1 hypothetical protein [Gemmata algarum]